MIVKHIINNREARILQVHSNLMCSTSKWKGFYYALIGQFFIFDKFEFGGCFFGIFSVSNLD